MISRKCLFETFVLLKFRTDKIPLWINVCKILPMHLFYYVFKVKINFIHLRNDYFHIVCIFKRGLSSSIARSQRPRARPRVQFKKDGVLYSRAF